MILKLDEEYHKKRTMVIQVGSNIKNLRSDFSPILFSLDT